MAVTDPRPALITLSHGSRHPHADAGIAELTAAAGDLLDLPAHPAHLDLSTPTLPDVALRLAVEGIREAVVVPLLFTRAFHATTDVPEAVRAATEVSGMRIALADGLGTGPDLVDVLAERLTVDRPDHRDAVLHPVGTSSARATADLARLGAELAERTGRRIDVIAATGPGDGPGAVLDRARAAGSLHVLPLFVTHGLLLDRITDRLPATRPGGPDISVSAPLGRDLARIVATRYSDALTSDRTPACVP